MARDENQEPIEHWRKYKNEGDNVIPEIHQKIQSFRHNCKQLLETHFQECLIALAEEEREEEAMQALLRRRSNRFLNVIPIVHQQDFEKVQNSFLAASRFPVTHYHNVDKRFSDLLGLSIARMMAFPIISFGVNTKETNAVLTQLASVNESKPTVAILFYRTVTRDIICVHWEISSSLVDNTHFGRGVDVTREVEASRLRQAMGIQKMLRQWLHSIRNASFEQQATVIMEEVKSLEKKIVENCTARIKTDDGAGGEVQTGEYAEDFQGIYDCVKLLLHTAKTSVGLIDQALDTKGLTQHMCAGDFVSNVVSFPHHFAQSEGLPAIYTKFRFELNGAVARPSDFMSFFVSGEVVSIQSIVDNILSNAVR
jgi:hypothetical protein